MGDQTAWVERYLGPISTSFSPLPSVSFGVSDSGSSCSGGRNNQRRTSFCSALRLLQPAVGGGGEPDGHTDNMAERTEGCDLQAADARYTHPSRSNLQGSFALTCQLHIVADLSGD